MRHYLLFTEKTRCIATIDGTRKQRLFKTLKCCIINGFLNENEEFIKLVILLNDMPLLLEIQFYLTIQKFS
jgi:hypothetical protein